MDASFAEMWGVPGAHRGPRLSDKLRSILRGGRLRERVVKVRRRLEKDTRCLEAELSRLKAMEKGLMAKAKEAYVEGDGVMANVFSNEVANLKNVILIIDKLRAAFKEMAIRLNVLLVTGDLASEFKKLRRLIEFVTPLVARTVPQFVGHIVDVNDVLEEFVRETEMNVDEVVPVEPISEEARRVLEAVKLAAQHDEESGLPESPSSGDALRTKHVRRVGGGS